MPSPSSAQDAALEVRDLHVHYRSFEAVRGLSLAVSPGEIFALLGTNGAGKTTTMETVEGLRAPTAGTVRVLGADPRDRRRVRPKVGIMMQESGFSPDLTATETVRLMGRLSGRHDHDTAVLERALLGHKRDVRVGQLSGGEKRRLDFACAIYGSPRVLFLDEPTTGMDVAARDALWHQVGDLRERGCAVVLTTHYLEEAGQHADRVALMHRGTLAYHGTVAEIAADFAATISYRATTCDEAPPLTAETTSGGHTTIRTRSLQHDLHVLLGWAATRGLELQALSARPASLDDIVRDLAATGAPGAPGPTSRSSSAPGRSTPSPTAPSSSTPSPATPSPSTPSPPTPSPSTLGPSTPSSSTLSPSSQSAGQASV